MTGLGGVARCLKSKAPSEARGRGGAGLGALNSKRGGVARCLKSKAPNEARGRGEAGLGALNSKRGGAGLFTNLPSVSPSLCVKNPKQKKSQKLSQTPGEIIDIFWDAFSVSVLKQHSPGRRRRQLKFEAFAAAGGHGEDHLLHGDAAVLEGSVVLPLVLVVGIWVDEIVVVLGEDKVVHDALDG